MEYRYWAYMESHPAHAVIPFAVRREAVDLLTWSWTDRLLPPQEQERPLPSPFTQGECQELLGVLRSFGDVPQAETGIQSIVLTRIVSRIMLRVAHWRQHHFRPHKPLPVDFWAGSGSTQSQARSQKAGFVRTAMDILVSCLLLGVPFLFYSKHGALRSDAEGGGIVQRNVIPVLVVGACTCLLAALLLSASITFLSLPGLDNAPPARVVVLVVAVLAAASVVAGLVALFRFKADLLAEDGTGAAATRTVIMSLPLVLLICAVLGFVAAVVLYSFFGTGTAGGRFADYTRWAVLGAVGGLGGILTMSALLLRR
ncbi:hypothetical protein C8F01DRAFT_983936 [Mycena amicta]|nr:hypothetical protein C8F01DRAFT_983936 [Mycena amicta]